MSKLVIFDLDGVLIDSRELHYDALNDALRKVGEEFVITREEHLSKYDGLNTTRKLKMLTEQKGLPLSTYDQVWQDKQEATFLAVPASMACLSKRNKQATSREASKL